MVNWKYLDTFQSNLLYIYCNCLENRTESVTLNDKNSDFGFSCEESNNRIYYIIWFVFRYCLECETLEQALQQNFEEIIDDYRLRQFFSARRIYIGSEDYKIKLNNAVGDLPILLEIIYGRYDVIKQLECFIDFKQNNKVARGKITALIKTAQKYLNDIHKRLEENDEE